jgi:hypothetical protein
MGLYPLFPCRDWHALPEDLNDLRAAGLASLTLVTDPLLGEAEREVFKYFDLVRPFKTHYLSSLEEPPERTVSSHHRYYARKAARELEVDVPASPSTSLDEWCTLYGQLTERHGVSDMRVFSREAFGCLLTLPGIVYYRALWQGRAVGAQIILIQDNVAFAHLAAFTDEGYRHGASYLLDWYALEHLRGRVRYVNWGGGSGLEDADKSGLARYKRGWATLRRTSYLLGAVLDQDCYARLVRNSGHEDARYFPQYRAGEFA